MNTIELKQDLNLISELAKKADNGIWTVDGRELRVLLESKNSVTAKTETGWSNNLAYISAIDPARVSRITGHILAKANVHREIRELAQKSTELALNASKGPWAYNEEKAEVCSADGVSLLSWIDYNDKNNCDYIAHCRPENMLTLIYWIQTDQQSVSRN